MMVFILHSGVYLGEILEIYLKWKEFYGKHRIKRISKRACA
jgi:hypothetical protein